MERNRNEKTMLRSQRILLPLIALAVLLVILAFSSAAKPVYADSPPDEWIWPGEGGGGGYYPPPSDMIEGYISQYHTSGAVQGVPVYFYDGTVEMGPAYTDSGGHFAYSSPYILHNWGYSVEVNGKFSELTHRLAVNQWSQSRGYVATNSYGYGCICLSLDTSTLVKVTYAALYSNSQYATLSYGTESNYNVEHTLTFDVPVAGVSVGYTTSIDKIYTAEFACSPSHAKLIYDSYFAGTCFDALQGKVISAGIGERNPYGPGGSMNTYEYTTPGNVNPAYTTVKSVGSGSDDYYYKESGSVTWKASVTPFGISIEGYGKVLSIDITVKVTTTSTQWVHIHLNNPTDHDLYFLLYTPSAAPAENSYGGIGELHVWDWTG